MLTLTERKQAAQLQDNVRTVAIDDDRHMQYDEASVEFSVVSACYWRTDINGRPWANLAVPVEGDDKPVWVAVRLEWLVLGVAFQLAQAALARGMKAVNEREAPSIRYRDSQPLNCCRANLVQVSSSSAPDGDYYEPYLPKEGVQTIYTQSTQRVSADETANATLFNNQFTDVTSGGNLYYIKDAEVHMLVSSSTRSQAAAEWSVALLDESMLPRVQHLRWSVKNRYIVGCVPGGSRKPVVTMHKLIAVDTENADPEQLFGRVVDHRNGRTYDNRCANLRLVTRQQNWANSRRRWAFRGAPDKRTRYAGYWRLRVKRLDDSEFDRQYRTLKECMRADYTLRRQAGAEREQILYQLHPLPKSVTADDLYTDVDIDAPEVLTELAAEPAVRQPATRVAPGRVITLSDDDSSSSQPVVKRRRNREDE